MSVLRINKAIEFAAYDTALMRATEKSLMDLQVKMQVVQEQEGEFAEANAVVVQVMTGMHGSNDTLRELSQVLKLTAEHDVKQFDSYLEKMRGNEETRQDYEAMLETRFNKSLKQTRQQVEQLRETSAGLSIIVMSAGLKASKDSIEIASQDQTIICQHQAAHAKLVSDLQALEQTIIEIRSAAAAGGAKLKQLQPSAQVIDAMHTIYGSINKVWELADLQKAVVELHVRIKAEQEAIQAQEAKTKSLVRQLAYFAFAEAFDQARGEYAKQIGILLNGIQNFLDACAAPEADWNVRVASYKTHTDSMNGYLAPLLNS